MRAGVVATPRIRSIKLIIIPQPISSLRDITYTYEKRVLSVIKYNLFSPQFYPLTRYLLQKRCELSLIILQYSLKVTRELTQGQSMSKEFRTWFPLGCKIYTI